MGGSEMINYVIFFLGFAVLYHVTLLRSKQDLIGKLLMAIALIMIIISNEGIVEQKNMRAFAQEVILTQVPSDGEYKSVAQVEIIYRKGKLAEVVLVKGTTKSKE